MISGYLISISIVWVTRLTLPPENCKGENIHSLSTCFVFSSVESQPLLICLQSVTGQTNSIHSHTSESQISLNMHVFGLCEDTAVAAEMVRTCRLQTERPSVP